VISQTIITTYKDLLFFQTAFKTTIEIINLTKTCPRNTALIIIFRQLIRASSSVGANIAEGFGRYKGKEYSRFLQIALGSANEVEYWLMIFKNSFPQYCSRLNTIFDLNNQTIRMLASSINSLNKKNT
jgi:four helix bundle protein